MFALGRPNTKQDQTSASFLGTITTSFKKKTFLSLSAECVCNANGTVPGFHDTCNYETGQCKCLANVIGIQCDKCADGFWNLNSGVGCEKCDCCGEGSTQATCNEVRAASFAW